MDPDQFAALVREVRSAREVSLRAEFDRSLPFADVIFDRWDRARELGFGEGASIYDSALVFGDVQVGEHTWVGPYTILDGSGGGLRIGAYCSVSTGVHLYTHDTVLWALSGGREPARRAPVSIGDRCHIGAQSVVAPGVKIGTQCVVGANSFVNHDVPDRTIVAGSPARPIGHVVVGDDGTIVGVGGS